MHRQFYYERRSGFVSCENGALGRGREGFGGSFLEKFWFSRIVSGGFARFGRGVVGVGHWGLKVAKSSGWWCLLGGCRVVRGSREKQPKMKFEV